MSEQPAARIRVVLVDDHPIVRAGIRGLLEAAPEIEIVGEGKNGAEAIALVASLEPDVLLLDMEMPDMTGSDVADRLKEQGGPTRILALSAYDDHEYIHALLARGAAGYLTKEEAPERIVEAVRGVAQGEDGWISRRAASSMARWARDEPSEMDALTEREEEVLTHLVKGWTNLKMARELGVSERTVRFHLSNIYDKLGVASRAETIAWAIRQGRG